MFFHNLNIALRNLAKYKLQTLISVLSIAIGIVVLAAAHSYVQTRLALPPLYSTPHFDRVCSLSFDSLHVDDRTWNGMSANGEVLRALTTGGQLHCAETEPVYFSNIYVNTTGKFCLGDTLERVSEESVMAVGSSYLNYAGYVSAITGKPVARLKPGEVVISELRARKIFGDINPVGAVVACGVKTYTVVDVYANPGCNGWPSPTTMMYVVGKEEIGSPDQGDYGEWIMQVVLKEGFTPEQLEQEVNPRLQPLGWKAKAGWLKEYREGLLLRFNSMRTSIYLMGALILLSACIGFLRMQLQLFRMRRRELSLRIVNGAKRRNLFSLLMTEVAMVLLAAMMLALLFGSWLEPFINTLYENTGDADDIQTLEHLLAYSAIIGALLLLLLAAAVWFALKNICRTACNLAEGMRGERSHSFRNVMLGLQITVGMFFVSAALLIALLCDKQSDSYVLPEDDRHYRESILVTGEVMRGLDAWGHLNDALQALPDVAQVISYKERAFLFEEIERKESLWKKVREASSYDFGFYTGDAAMVDYFNVHPTWLRPELKGKSCLLIREDVYAVLDSAGVLANGVLTNYGESAIPVAGTFKEVELTERDNPWKRYYYIYIDTNCKADDCRSILIPKPGKYGVLWNEVEATVERLVPDLVQPIVFNLYDKEGAQVEMLNNVRQGGWLLGAVALVVCVMGIYSTIVLDTRARRKEVAIRKINGAKPKDIALLFVRLYVVLIALSVALCLPLSLVLEDILIENYFSEHFADTSAVICLALAGCGIVILSIALIVGWQVRSIMRINPAEMVAKE